MPRTPERVLVVESDREQADLLRRACLAAEYSCEVEVRLTLEAAREHLRQTESDMVLISVALPDGRGVELLRQPAASHTPVVVTSSRHDETAEREAFDAGASDFLVKSGAAIAELPRTLVRVLRYWDSLQDRRRAEQQLRVHEERLELALAGADQMLWDCRLDRREYYCDDAWYKLFGYDRSEISSSFDFSKGLLHPDDLPRVTAHFDAHLSGNEPYFESEHRLRTKDGQWRWVSVRGKVTQLDQQGRPLRVTGVQRDIHEQRMAERRLRETEHELAHVGRLTTMGEMLAGIAHEINQPLHAIGNFASACQALLDKPSPPVRQVREWVEQISQQVARASGIIARLRNFARKGTMDRAPHVVNELIRDALALLSPELERRSVTVELQLEAGLPKVEIDRIQIQQVLVNLARNAYEAMENVDIAERRLAVRSAAGDGEVEISLCDSGPGLPNDDEDAVFEPFYSSKPQGLGMGLPISRSIVEAHGGRLWPKNRESGGACFHFTLPVHSEQSVSTAARTG